jgi:hypothetical protein
LELPDSRATLSDPAKHVEAVFDPDVEVACAMAGTGACDGEGADTVGILSVVGADGDVGLVAVGGVRVGTAATGNIVGGLISFAAMATYVVNGALLLATQSPDVAVSVVNVSLAHSVSA